MNARERLLKDFTRSKKYLPGHLLPWLNDLRESAIKNFAAQGFPSPKDESWKYTNTKKLQQTEYCLAQQSIIPPTDSLTAQISEQQFCPDEHRMVFINGTYHHDLSSNPPLPKGIILSSFAQALQDHPILIASTLGEMVNHQTHPFSALNSAFMSDGLFLWAAENSQMAPPIHCLFISTTTAKTVVCYPRLLLVLKNKTQLTLIEHYIDLCSPRSDPDMTAANGTSGNPNLINAVTEIHLGSEAQLDHYKLQRESLNSSHIAAMYVQQHQASRFTSHSYSLGAPLARYDIQVELTGSQCECCLNGVYLADDNQHVDYHTQITHLAPGCSSQQLYKGVIQGHARAVFNGKVIIHPEAQQSNAKQLNNNLLLSDNGEVDTKPELQIYADDVICNHGATVGQLDTQALFYLQSRGISEKDAQACLVDGFVGELLERINHLSLRNFIQLSISAQLKQLVGNDAGNLALFPPMENGEMLCP
ncbi:Iron-regulated ABC transporter permease protein SufD [Psychromonas ingrahamii 37]|uniref:Iron-regulated ABC transporter permease protein SufD n=1 Tax=Psychromonas ingrahamii (strain DSM 17664 / CCUG 51855 / 37) TaxID=357804 RepID=A1SV04_PSYIN|nr:Fe-S cluster assembly protein SufD [Psychromonas ingrahamii]ABM03319.1 Iron-regulated ABC transporter permease protein SufD [Psychromonas ingrahamii 37]